MERQHMENLFRRYKGNVVTIKSLSGAVYRGHVGEITNDYVLLSDRESDGGPKTFIVFEAIESIVVGGTPA